jgi:hypothetical protein
MDRDRSAYHAYLLRLWQVKPAPGGSSGEPVWRASLENPHTGERVGFAGLDDLVGYLRHQMDASASTGAQERGERR